MQSPQLLSASCILNNTEGENLGEIGELDSQGNLPPQQRGQLDAFLRLLSQGPRF